MSQLLAAVSAVLLLQPAPAARPVAVQVEAAAASAPAVQEWAKELRAALQARKDEFRVVKPGEPAEFVVKLDSIEPGKDGPSKVSGRLVAGTSERPFTYTYTSIAEDAAKLARNLRPLVDKMRPAAK